MKHSKADIEATVLRYSSHLLRLAFSYLKNIAEAEDVTQDVFIAYTEKAPFFLKESSRRAWLMTTTANLCRDILRKTKHHETVTLTEDLAYLPKENRELLTCVMSLDEKYRIPIHLYYYEGYRLKEIARILHSNTQTIGTRLARGRKQLKEMIGDDFDEA